MSKKKRVIVAIGGNSLTPSDSSNWIGSMFMNARKSMESIIPLINEGYEVVLTHGNGPQVGIALKRIEETENTLPEIPLGVLVAETEGSIGYTIEQCLQNKLLENNIKKSVATVLTQVIVDKNDPALQNPTKFVGSFYTEQEASKYAEEKGWIVKKDANRGFRRVVGSPEPIDIANNKVIDDLLSCGNIVIAAGGGGIPVFVDEKGRFEGLDAVIDKDKASAKLGSLINAEELYILTGVDKVAINFGTEEQKDLDRLTVAEASNLLAEGQFPKGSMGPKIEAAIQFIKDGGKRVIITDIDKLMDAIKGENGTSIVP